MKQKIIDIKSIDEEIFEGELKVISDDISRLISEFGENTVLRLDSGYSNISANISFEREETDDEYKKRLIKEENEEKKRSKKEQKEYEQYLKLKAKFEE
jgi:hypothetical protein